MTVRGALLRGEMALRGNQVVQTAINSWRQGSPVWELPLLNHLTGRLSEVQGVIEIHGSRFRTRIDVSDFHQQGVGLQDLYGADLAVAVHLAEPAVVKYALFQLKVPGESEDYVDLKKNQLSAALDPEVKDRTFVVAVDRKQGEPRVRSVRLLYDEFDSKSPKGRFETTQWGALEEWMHQWLTCHIGRESPNLLPGDLQPGTLESRITTRELLGSGGTAREERLPEQYKRDLVYSQQRPIPARTFARIFVTPEQRNER